MAISPSLIKQEATNLTGYLLFSSPAIANVFIPKTVLLVTDHGPLGSNAIALNIPLAKISDRDIAMQYGIQSTQPFEETLFFGGPFSNTKCHILHSLDYMNHHTRLVNPHLGITSTLDILTDIIQKKGPQNHIILLGEIVWKPKKLEEEITDNHWIVATYQKNFIFDSKEEMMWHDGLSNCVAQPIFFSQTQGYC